MDRPDSSGRQLRLQQLLDLTAGIGILSQQNRSNWMAARVAGDAMDLALMGGAFLGKRRGHVRAILATAAVEGVAALDILCTQDLKHGPGAERQALPASKGATTLRRSLIVNRPAEELYRVWRNFSGLPEFMSHLISVEQVSDNKWHWAAKGPMGSRVEWDATGLCRRT